MAAFLAWKDDKGNPMDKDSVAQDKIFYADWIDDMWEILDNGIDIPVNELGVADDTKSLTLAQKNTFRKHHRVRRILVEALPHTEYIKIIDKSTGKTIF